MTAININYDDYNEAKDYQIKYFLDYIYDLQKENPKLKLSRNFVFSELERYGLQGNNIGEKRQFVNVEEYFRKWIQYYSGDPDIQVCLIDTKPEFCYFVNGNIGRNNNRDFIKLYIPIDRDYLYDGAIRLFNYIASLGVEHESKIARKIRSDNVVVRLNAKDSEAAKMIVDFVTSDQYLKSRLNSVNPYLPTYKGIGFIRESGISYNGEIGEAISQYIDMVVSQNRQPNIVEFREFLKANCRYPEVLVNFDYAMGNNDEHYTEEQRRNVFVDSLKTTYIKYGINQVSNALKAAINNNDFTWFSNGSGKVKYRRQLMNMGADAIIKYMSQYLASFSDTKDLPQNTDALVDEFVKLFFADDLAFRVDEACTVTLLKSDRKQLENALKTMVEKETFDWFSRFYNDDQSVNYRAQLMRLGKHNVVFGMERSLAYKGIDIRNVPYSNLISTYVNELDKAVYAKFDDTPKVSKM